MEKASPKSPKSPKMGLLYHGVKFPHAPDPAMRCRKRIHEDAARGAILLELDPQVFSG
jgi:hypothetical protein